MEKMNPAYFYAILCMIAIVAEMITNFGNPLAVLIGLGFFQIIYVLDKILKKL